VAVAPPGSQRRGLKSFTDSMGCLNSVADSPGYKPQANSGGAAYAQPYQPGGGQAAYSQPYQPGGQPGYAQPYQPGGQSGGYNPGGQPAYAQSYQPGGQSGGYNPGGQAYNPGGAAYNQAYKPGGPAGGGYNPGQSMQQQQQGQAIRCGQCGQVFGCPPGHAQVRCPKCNMVNAVPVQQPQATIPQNPYNQQLGTQPAVVGQPGPAPSGNKRALLVGINYPGTRAELRGCINDVHRMQGMLVQMYGFSPQAMMVLTDDSPNPQMRPTRQNILMALQWLAQGVQPGDCLFFHYSGHGAQQEDPTYSEEDGYDETICPMDFESAGMIVDDEIFDFIVAPLPSGAKLTAVMDCCHSGTGLDLPFIWQPHGWQEEDNPAHSAGDVVLISGCQDDQTSSDGGGGYSKPMGAMTTALCNTLERNPVLSHVEMLQGLRTELRRGGFDQIPSLTASQRFNANKPFTPCDNIDGNMNPQLGRQFRKKKHPKRPNLLQGGLGEMLAAGAVGFLAADMMMGGDIASGLMMGTAGMIGDTGGMMMDTMGGAADLGGDAIDGGMSFFDDAF